MLHPSYPHNMILVCPYPKQGTIFENLLVTDEDRFTNPCYKDTNLFLKYHVYSI